ncbi:hypothetical protein PR003_g17382 [Phytophthora rubi]|uniref:Uncharacterized protein n=1 Tax=Phytophthora rubi TaxID=129364 RepID=A0A6A4EH43_9STRA|nr:hypothetical protein PR003_g17382 [Phytophthora rubi]
MHGVWAHPRAVVVHRYALHEVVWRRRRDADAADAIGACCARGADMCHLHECMVGLGGGGGRARASRSTQRVWLVNFEQ